MATIFIVATLTFFIMNLVPGGPFLSEKAITPQAQAAMEAKYGMDKSLFEQYLTYMKDLSHGDLGQSIKQRDYTVNRIITERFPVSARLGGLAILVVFFVGVPLGVVASMCDHIAVMYAGEIVEYGETDDIFYDPRHEYTKGLIRSIPRLSEKEYERLVPIEGQPVDLLNRPDGRPFASRCNACMKICLREEPGETYFSACHYARCWMNDKAEFEKGKSHTNE